ncbi:MAG: 2-phospho-L-lactate transferase [Anaerolineaceae bacterium]|jgi:LPPG:FO 2-phospho-L-lactate transferase
MKIVLKNKKVVLFAGGVGGAKLAVGLQEHVPPENLSIIVNTGDDCELFGMRICPDLDTVMYNLAGIADSTKGWGQAKETYRVMQALKSLKAPDWFLLGDKDLGTHLYRTRLLKEGLSLTEVTRNLCSRFGIGCSVLPMTNDPAPTVIHTQDGRHLSFQEYFVREGYDPKIKEIELYHGSQPRASEEVMQSLEQASIIILGPSNPWVSLDPILLLPGVKQVLWAKTILGVSGIINGKAIKGPAAKMFKELGIEPNSLNVMRHYQDLLKGFVIDTTDELDSDKFNQEGIILFRTNTIMKEKRDKTALAKEVLQFGFSLT